MSDQKEPQEKRPREKITLDTVIPPLPAKADRLPPPDEDRFEREMKNLEAKISKLRDQKKGVNNQINLKIQGGKMENQDVSVKDFISSKVESRKEKNLLRNKLRDELQLLKQTFYEMIDEQKRIRPKIKIFDSSKTKTQIEQIQYKIESTSLSLQEEKKLISELSELEQSLPLIEQHATRAKQIDDNKARQEVIKAQIDAISAEIDSTNALIDETHAKIKSSKDQRDSEIPQMKKERQDIDEQIEKLQQEKKKLVDEFRDKKFAYKKQQNEIKQIEWITKMKQKLVEQEERRKKDEERARLEEENKPHPYANEILSCDAFIAYLARFFPKEELKVDEKQQAADYLPHKSEVGSKESEEWFGKKQKKEKKQKKKKAVGMTHPIDLLNFYSYHGLKVPVNAEEAKKSAEELSQLKRKWEQLDSRETAVEEKKEEPVDARGQGIALDPVDFPEPENSKVQAAYQLFEDKGPRPAASEESSGRRGRGRGARGAGRGRGRGRGQGRQEKTEEVGVEKTE